MARLYLLFASANCRHAKTAFEDESEPNFSINF